MKSTIQQLAGIFLTGILLFSCTDVIDVDVPTGEPRLVVEASIDWEKGTDGKTQEIILSKMTPYYSNKELIEVKGAQVSIKNETTGDTFPFSDQNNGTYKTNSFIPVLNNTYILTIVYDGVTYQGKEVMTPVTDIALIDQSRDGGNSSEYTEVNFHFQDPVNEENFYMFRFQRTGDLLPNLVPISDEFTDGNIMDESFEKEDDPDTDKKEELKPGDVVQYELHGISKRYYSYMQILVNQLRDEASLFSGVPVELKGNCTNVNDSKDFTLGYFRLTQTIKGEYTIQ